MKHSDIIKLENQLYYQLKLLIVATLLFLMAFILTYSRINSTGIQGECAVVYLDDGREPYVQNSSADGAALFKNNCASCHNKNMKSRLTGPALGGVTDRWESDELLYAFIRNSQKVIVSKDEYAVALFNEYDKSVMTSFPELTDEEIEAILDYVENRFK